MEDNLNKELPSPSAGEIGQTGLLLHRTFVDENKEADMAMSKRPYVFDEMSRDPAVKAPLERTTTPIIKALAQGRWVGTGTRRSEVLADYMSSWMHTMEGQTWLQFCSNMCSDVKYGFSLAETLTTRAKRGQYKGTIVPKRFAPRSQKSLYAWVWDDNFSRVLGYVQKPNKTRLTSIPESFKSFYGNAADLSHLSSEIKDWDFPIISMEESIHSMFGSVNGNPEGESPLEACYNPWKEKQIINQYQLIGISRDLGGIPVLRLPQELINRANDPDNKYPSDRLVYEEFQRQLANMHAGKQAYIILPSDLIENSSVPIYEFKLLGIEGAGKQFDIQAIVNSKNQEIANAFLAGHLLLGQQGNTTSYNASTAGAANNSLMIEKSILEKVNILKYQLAVALFDANNIYYTQKDIPDFKYKDPDQITLDEAGKFIQRVDSVGKMTEEMMRDVNNAVDLSIDNLDSLAYGKEKAELEGGSGSGAGKSQGSSGTGGTQSGGASTSTNVENKQLEPIQHLVIDGNTLVDSEGKYIKELDT